MKLATVFLAAAVLSGCTSDRVGSDSAGSPARGKTSASGHSPGSGPLGDYWFIERAEEAGLRFVHFNGMSGEFYLPESIPPGVGLLDFDNDGDLDVFLVQGQMLGDGKTISQALFRPEGPLPLRGRLFRNDLQVRADGTRSLHFTDVTDQSGIDAPGYGMGIAAGDINNDGCVDLYLTNLGQNQMFRNNCDGTFTDVSRESGADGTGSGVSASFLDYDRDGWLDLYVGNYVWYVGRTWTCLVWALLPWMLAALSGPRTSREQTGGTLLSLGRILAVGRRASARRPQEQLLPVPEGQITTVGAH